MAGNTAGGLKCKAKNLAKDPNFYHKIGKLGGQTSKGYAFGHGKVDPRIIGKKGGLAPRKRKYEK